MVFLQQPTMTTTIAFAYALIAYWLVCWPLVRAAREPPIVTLPDQGQLQGVHQKMQRIQRIVAYLGVPYAQPPTGDRRFQPPVVDDLPAWEGVRNASQLQPECWSDGRRPAKQHEEAFGRLVGSSRRWNAALYDEDCLYLNIYRPDGTSRSWQWWLLCSVCLSV